MEWACRSRCQQGQAAGYGHRGTGRVRRTERLWAANDIVIRGSIPLEVGVSLVTSA